MFQNTKKTKAIIFLSIIILASFFVFLSIHQASAANIIDPGALDAATKQVDAIRNGTASNSSTVLGSAASWAADKILQGVLALMGYLLSLAASLFIWVIDPSIIGKTIGDPIVYKIWAQIRDVVNVAFILMLLFSAFCTIFQVEKYSYKKILITLIVMALLVNFSFPIARFIIDVSNVLMYYFINALGFSGGNGGTSFQGIIKGSSLDALFKNPSPDLATLLAQIIFAFVFAVTLLTTGVLLVVRLIVLTILVMFSSIAFVGSVVPFLSSQASKWWDALFKHAFFGPIMIFMIYVAALVMGEVTKATTNISTITARQADTPTKDFITSLVLCAVPIVILWVGLGVAQSMNIAAAGAITGAGKKVGAWGIRTFSGYSAARYVGVKTGKGIKTATGYGATATWQKFDRDILMKHNLSPTAWTKAWKDRRARVQQEALDISSGRAEDKLNLWMDNTKTNKEKLANSRRTTKRLKEYEEMTQETRFLLNNELVKNMGVKSKEAESSIDALGRFAYSRRDQDDFMHYVKNNWDKPISPSGKSFKDIIEEVKTEDPDFKFDGTPEDLGVDGYNSGRVMYALLRASGADKQRAIEAVHDYGSIAAGNGGTGFNTTMVDPQTGQLRLAQNKWETAKGLMGKFSTIDEAQNAVKKLHRNVLINEDGSGGINEANLAELVRSGMAGEMSEHANRFNPSFYKTVGRDPKAMTNIRNYIEKMRTEGVEEWNAKDNKIEKTTISDEQAKSALKLFDNIQSIAQGKGKLAAGAGKKEAAVEESSLVDQYGRPTNR